MKRSKAAEGPKKLSATFEARACQFSAAGKIDKAEVTYSEWIETTCGSAQARARYAYASFLVHQKEYPRAKEMVEQSIELDRNCFNSQILLASIFEHEENFAKSIETYTYAHTFLSEQATAQSLGTLLCDRGNLWFALGDITKSIADYKEGLKLYPKLYMAQWDLAVMLRDNGDFHEAQAHFDVSMQSNHITKDQGRTYVEFLVTPAFQHEYDEMCQVAKFPCHALCGAVTVDLMFLNWAKLSPGLRNYTRHSCTCAFNNVISKYRVHAERYRSAISEETKLLAVVTEKIVDFLMGDPITFLS